LKESLKNEVILAKKKTHYNFESSISQRNHKHSLNPCIDMGALMPPYEFVPNRLFQDSNFKS